MRAGILRLGNEQLAEVGAAAISVREIARGLGVASSAIYRHVASRDELLTLLLVDAYTDLADAALEALEPGAAPSAQLAALAHGMRGWAVANPARWALAYGSPVPGYAAPAEQTTEPGTRVMVAFLRLIVAGVPGAAGPGPVGFGAGAGDRDARARGVSTAPVSAAFAAEIAAGAAEFGIEADPELAAAAIEAWTGLIGLVSAEVFGQLGPDFARHGAEMLDRWIAGTALRLGLPA